MLIGKSRREGRGAFGFFYGGYFCVCLLFPFGVLILLPAMSACTYLPFLHHSPAGVVGGKRKQSKTKKPKNKTTNPSFQDLSGWKTEAFYSYLLFSLATSKHLQCRNSEFGIVFFVDTSTVLNYTR